MRNLIQTIKNIFSIEDLRFRIFYTLGFVLIYRLGSYVILPGVNIQALQSKGEAEGLASLINMFAGGAFSRASVFALGIMPYISASIVVQLLSMAFPYFQRMQKEGESGRRKINQYTRFLTIIITALQAPGFITTQLTSYGGVVADPSTLWWFTTVTILVAGTIFVMWLGERITDRGLGNGISILIMIGIVADLPFAFFSEFASRMEAKGGGLIMMLLELVFLLFVIISSILLVQGTRKIPVQFAKKIVGNRQYGGVRQYIPLKVNAAGVMPIIFAQAIMFIPLTLAGFASSDKLSGIIGTLSNHNGFTYNLIFALLIIIFTYFYTAIMVNPTQMADDMKRNGGFIPGIKPGKQTASFIDDVMSKITLPGSLFLSLVAVMPAISMSFFGVNDQFSRFFGGTSLLILVGVMLDTLQQIESHLLMRHYDGLMKTGRIKGRSSMSMATA
ncbi:MAG: preprotein translocase subunit SecY [Bacteroidetes bacterium]|nr:MAG: preprotein translocase subunit SecY [Bacteroidota bacterium]